MEAIFSKFSNWTPWSERTSLSLSWPGVYVLAEFEGAPPLTSPTASSKLMYVGETCGQSLRDRLYQFNRSGFEGKLAHSGGSTYALMRESLPSPGALFVSVMAVDLVGSKASAFIRYAERALLWSHVQEHGDYPKCNHK